MTTLKMPEADAAGFVKTLNNMGFMTSVLDPYSQAFVDFSSSAPGPVLDIGAAYGVATLAALDRGATVIANDVDDRHLKILSDRTPISDRSRLELRAGSFPSELSFEPNSLGAILVCRVLHFFSPEEIQKALSTAFQWLAPGGQLFVVTETPYVGTLKKFIPVYEARRAANANWPGVMNVAEVDPELCKALPAQMHLLDPDVLSREFKLAGFEILQAGTMARSDFPERLQLDGRESVGIIGVKR